MMADKYVVAVDESKFAEDAFECKFYNDTQIVLVFTVLINADRSTSPSPKYWSVI